MEKKEEKERKTKEEEEEEEKTILIRLVDLLSIEEAQNWKSGYPTSSLAFISSLKVKPPVMAILSKGNPITIFLQHTQCLSQLFPLSRSVQGASLPVTKNK